MNKHKGWTNKQTWLEQKEERVPIFLEDIIPRGQINQNKKGKKMTKLPRRYTLEAKNEQGETICEWLESDNLPDAILETHEVELPPGSYMTTIQEWKPTKTEKTFPVKR